MKIKKFIPALTTSLIIMPIILTTACEATKTKKEIKLPTAAAKFFDENAWTSFIMTNPNPEGKTLDIPEMIDWDLDLKPTAKELSLYPNMKTEHINVKDSNKQAFNEKKPAKVYNINYQQLTKGSQSDKEVEVILKNEFLRINKEIKSFLINNKNNKYAAYFSKNSTNFKVEIKPLKEVTQEGMKKVREHFAKESDLNDKSLVEFKGHAFWNREAMINRERCEKTFHMKSNIDDFFNGSNKTYKPLNNEPFLDNKIRLKDKDDKDFTLDPRSYAKNSKEQKKWLSNKYKKLFYDNKTNINSYPYLNMQTNELNVMLIFSDKDSYIKNIHLDIGAPSVIFNAKQIDYKVIKIKNFLPITNKPQKITPTQKSNIFNLIKAAILWLEEFGGPTLLYSMKLLKKTIPNSQSVVEPILPLIETWKRQDLKFKEKEKIIDYKLVDVQKLDLWKNIELKSEDILEQFQKMNFDFSQIQQLSKDIFKTKKSTDGSKDIIDKENSSFWKWNSAWITTLDGRNNHYLLTMLFILRCAVKGMV